MYSQKPERPTGRDGRVFEKRKTRIRSQDDGALLAGEHDETEEAQGQAEEGHEGVARKGQDEDGGGPGVETLNRLVNSSRGRGCAPARVKKVG